MAIIHPVILAGGSGTRLWPLSRKSYPKQFAALTGPESLFQASVKRLSGDGFAAPVILTGEDYRFIATEQMAAVEMAAQTILIEPSAKSTAPAILAAALWLAERDPDALMLVAPSDQAISDHNAFQSTVKAASQPALNGAIVTFGITPTGPETGFGYLELPEGVHHGDKPVPLVQFVEKPNSETAKEMLASGNYLWNAGIFLFSASTMIEAFKALAPDQVEPVKNAVDKSTTDLGFTRLDAEAWEALDDISIDYAIMEKFDNLVVMPFEKGWTDLGGWQAVWQESDPDTQGNVCSENAASIDCSNTLLRSESDSLQLVGIGLDDIVAVAMPDAVVVAKKSESQRVKEAVSLLKSKSIKQATEFPRDHRPWGWFESLVMGDRFQVKRIVVNPGAALSLQSHHHRSEHWIVVEGTAKITIDDEVKLVSENQSVYIPLGAVHRMENPGKLPMVLIEVQTGAYLGEDDIVRYEDVYARS